MIASISQFKRALKVGAVVEVSNYGHPELSGRRTVLAAQGRNFALSLPEGHPDKERVDAEGGSWSDIPKASECRFMGGWMITDIASYHIPDATSL